MKFKIVIFSTFVLFSYKLFAQEAPKILLPAGKEWTQLKEGSEVSFELKVEGKNCEKFRFTIPQGKLDGMAFDSLGRFTWTPPYSMVDRLDSYKFQQVIFEAKCDSTNETISSKVEFRIQHVNRSPVIRDLKPFYVQYNTNNVYKIDRDFVYDEDNDPIVVIPSFESMPEGMKMTSQGEISWSPSLTQFKKLKDKTLDGNPMFLEFYVEDQPAKTQSKGRLKIEATQIDLPPEIVVVPKDNVFKIKENQTINIRFYLSDPNGDDDIHEFDFLTDNPNVSKKNLIKNTSNQYEFTWQPGYDFVKDPLDSLGFNIDFFVLDKTKKRDVKTIRFVVKNAINEAETDLKLYNLYRGTLTRGWELLEQMKEKEDELKKAYIRAKKGKKNRSVINASLGATTSLSSVFVPKDKPDQQRLISTLGGTTVLTIGTLEATEVIGRSMKDIIDRLNYIIEKKNELQSKGDIFARDFALKSSRRGNDFIRKVDDFMNVMSLKGLVVLDLDAAWEPKNKATDANIKKVFKDFNAE
ncbi:hypothetical protein [Emticicia sp. W12TSBA100-4]|uniref:hypothetical protein n=1 Tax=Emticicia sp. W12TSBA100-4 TaxID=3160965 RepID=UPI00330629AF